MVRDGRSKRETRCMCHEQVPTPGSVVLMQEMYPCKTPGSTE